MKLMAKILFYLGICCVVAGGGVLTFGFMQNNQIALIAGVFLFVAAIVIEVIAVRLSLAIDHKENPVETKEEGRKPH